MSKNNDTLCECKSPIVCSKADELNKKGCYWDAINWILFILLFLATPATIIPMSFGFWINMPDTKINNGLLVITTIFSCMLSFIIWVIFFLIQIADRECLPPLSKYYENIALFSTLVAVNFILFIWHVIGYLFSKYHYGIDTFFNYVTCGYGYIISFFALSACLVIVVVSFCIYKLVNHIRQINSKKVVKYGVAV